MKIIIRSALAILLLLGTTNCARLMGGLRPDLNDDQANNGPTQGGQWPERGFLSDDAPETPNSGYSSVGHSERGIASVTGGTNAGDPAWVGQDQADANVRDAYRGDGNNGPAFSSTPNLNPPTKRLYRNGNRATRADFVDDSQNEGSLWASDGQTNYYFTKNKIRGVGDIVTVKMETAFTKDLATEIKRTLTPDEKDAEIAMAQLRIRQKALGITPTTDPAVAAAGGAGPGGPGTPPAAATPPADGRAPASISDKDLPQATAADIDVSKSIDVKDGDPVMAEIIERYPNGNYKIRGSKKILMKTGAPRLVTMMGIARGVDIGEDDTINSGKLYEYRLEAFR